jgi:ribosomal protein S7
MIDVPTCFKKSESLKNKSLELPLLKFANYLMKKGKREKTIVLLVKAFSLFFQTLKKENIVSWEGSTT